MDFSIIIPAYNEEKRIAPTLTEIQDVLARTQHTFEIIVVDDGSKDNTVELLKTLQQEIPQLRIEALTQNAGKGHALRHGVAAAQGDIIITADADGSTPFSEYEKLYGAHEQNTDAIAIGSRHLPTSNVVIKQPWYRILISRMANVIIQTMLVPGVKDTQCGFKLYPAQTAKELYSQTSVDGFGIDMEVLYLAKRENIPIVEVPVTWLDSKESTLRPIRATWNTFKELVRIIWRHK